ncbi:MAG: c-type cytochrome biogenesis protein CcmI [Gemmobacter sp.]
MVFWGLAGAMVLAVAGLLALALLRPRAGAAEAAAAWDLRVYRDQLREVDRDLARGTIPSEEADRLRAEIGRRVLEADRRRGGGPAPDSTPPVAGVAAVGLIVVALVGAALIIYPRIGAPGYPDLPLERRLAAAEELRKSRPGQAEAEADARAFLAPPEPLEPQHAALLEQLREVVAGRPDDLRGQELLARNEAAAGDFAAAARAQERVIALRGPHATAQDRMLLAELMILATGGYVSPEAEQVLAQVLRADPRNGLARYYTGLMLMQVDRPDLAFPIWRGLWADSREDAPWVPPLRAQLPDAAWRAGVHNFQIPPLAAAAPGPDAADVEAAAALDPEARMAMIRGMVEGLKVRLASEGGPAEDWARLIRAYGVLGETEAARRIWTEAREVFSADAADMAEISAAARDAGIAD